ncbi:MAG: nicotinate-nucleotide adenylyltransferase [Sulfuricaulis sp.]|uniref:nicotinate-nucleotide adenylyltransferase n=1 Tax=Sulfuricaulis sp. TaxID=2003553 RepID=UPI0025E3B63A|nr:nicotinate-nucleotide adenylyltransferase [Sulfuricaulis sp.]MCR4347024.1 nicotinate-nucleotide adenylyltransferase [Sulfuricaulis sp.]
MKPIGILGGTFDPVHYGHMRPAQEVLRALDLAEVRIIPAAHPPHRRPPLATVDQRLRMVELAVAEFPGLRVDDREIRRGGPSYTVLTLESLREEFSERPLCLLLGLDAFDGIGTWHQWQRLPELAHFIVMTRPGWNIPAGVTLPSWARGRLARTAGDLAQASAGRIYFQTVTPQDISATHIRESIARGEAVDGLLPPAVLDYLRANRIYLNREN